MKERIRWIDIAKCFGIFAIYLGHLGSAVGRSFYFVFSHHVALFFFLAGCMEVFNKEENFVKYLIKKIKNVMVPFWIFAGMSAIVSIICWEKQWSEVKGLIVEVLRGVVRNTYVAGSLWFLTCLFVMQMLFFVIKKVRYKSIILLLVALCYVVAIYVLNPSPASLPCMYYNVDSALYYIIFYGIGYVAFPYIKDMFELDTIKKKWIFAGTALVSLGYTMSVFFGFDLFTMLAGVPFSKDVLSVVSPCVMIYAYLVVAKLLEDVTVLAQIGENTLYLCGSEYMIQVLFVEAMALLGLAVDTSGPVRGYIYTGILIYLANRFLVPIEKYIIQKVNW